MHNHSDPEDKPTDMAVDLAWDEFEDEPPLAREAPRPTAQERQRNRANNAANLAELNRAMRDHIERAVKELTKADPARWSNYQSKINAVVVPKSAGATRDTYRAIIQRILTVQGATSTQTGIREFVMEVSKVGDLKDWTKPIPAWVMKGIATMVTTADPPFNQIALGAGMTLSKLHREAKRLYAIHTNGDSQEIKARIVLTPDTVFINGKPWTISKKQQRIIVSIAQLEGLRK